MKVSVMSSLLIVFLGASAFALSHPKPSGTPNPGIFGSWQSEVADNDLATRVTIEITPTYANLTAECMFPAELPVIMTTTHLRVEAEVGSDSIWFGPGHASSSSGGLKCPISSPGDMGQYRLNGDTLTFLDKNGQPQYASNGEMVVFKRK